MKEQKRQWIIDLFTILAMMAAVILLCHPIGRKWNDEEIDRYVGADGAYSPDVDSYYYLRKAKEFAEGGISSIKLISYRTEDTKCTSGETISKEANGAMPMLLPASAALVWHGLRAVGIEVSIYALTIRFCSFLLSLFVIPIYFFLKRRTSWLAAVTGALLAPLEAPFFRHSHVGFFDTDAMIGLLALVLVLALFECFIRESRKEQLTYGIIAFAALILLRFTWTAFFIYGIIAVGTATMGIIGVRLCGKFEAKQKKALTFPMAVCGLVVAASLVFGWDSFVSLAKGFVSTPSGAGDWPSETLKISELRKVPLSDADSFWYHFIGVGSDVTSVTGGALALLVVLLSAVICTFKLIRLILSRSEESGKVFVLSALLTWLFGATVLGFFGSRYMEFVVLPSAVVSGIGVSHIMDFCKAKSVNGKRMLYVLIGGMAFCGLILRFPVAAVFVSALTFVAGWFLAEQKNGTVLKVAMIAAILFPLGLSCVVICAQEEPYIERSMEDAMAWTRENTNPDSVIADFWNLGYTYQYYGERRTVADGGTYNGQFFYWLAHMVITDDVHMSAGIARMLQNCGIDGSEYATELTGKAENARLLLWAILPLSRLDAEKKLTEEYTFSPSQINRLLDYTHPEDYPDIYFAASHNTFGVISALMTYRNWETAEEELHDRTYYSRATVSRPKENETVISKLVLGTDSSVGALIAVEAKGDELTGAVVTPGSEIIDCGRVIYIRDGEIIGDHLTGQPSEGHGYMPDYAVMLFEEKGEVSVVLLEKGAADSVFIRLFLMNGKDQTVFEKVYDSEKEHDSIQSRMDDNSSISLWKIHFE